MIGKFLFLSVFLHSCFIAMKPAFFPLGAEQLFLFVILSLKVLVNRASLLRPIHAFVRLFFQFGMHNKKKWKHALTITTNRKEAFA